MERWWQASPEANAQPLLMMAEQKDVNKPHQADQREHRCKNKALVEAAALLVASKKFETSWGEDHGD